MGDTPLGWVSANRHEGVVKILLGRDEINPNMPGKDDQTPLLRAARNGHERVLKILLGGNDIDPNRPDEYGGTQLGWASGNGDEGVVRLLLGRGYLSPDEVGLATSGVSGTAEQAGESAQFSRNSEGRTQTAKPS